MESFKNKYIIWKAIYKNIIRTLQATMTGFTFFSRTHKTLPWISRTLNQDTSLNNFQKLKYVRVYSLATLELIWTAKQIHQHFQTAGILKKYIFRKFIEEIRIKKIFKMYNKQLMKMDGMKQKTGLRWKCIVLKTYLIRRLKINIQHCFSRNYSKSNPNEVDRLQ